MRRRKRKKLGRSYEKADVGQPESVGAAFPPITSLDVRFGQSRVSFKEIGSGKKLRRKKRKKGKRMKEIQ